MKFDRSHVASFGESAIRIETVYFVLDPDYKKYMDVQQAINLEVLRRFAAQNVKFAFPSRTVYHEGPMAKDLAWERSRRRRPVAYAVQQSLDPALRPPRSTAR